MTILVSLGFPGLQFLLNPPLGSLPGFLGFPGSSLLGASEGPGPGAGTNPERHLGPPGPCTHRARTHRASQGCRYIGQGSTGQGTAGRCTGRVVPGPDTTPWVHLPGTPSTHPGKPRKPRRRQRWSKVVILGPEGGQKAAKVVILGPESGQKRPKVAKVVPKVAKVTIFLQKWSKSEQKWPYISREAREEPRGGIPACE